MANEPEAFVRWTDGWGNQRETAVLAVFNDEDTKLCVTSDDQDYRIIPIWDEGEVTPSGVVYDEYVDELDTQTMHQQWRP